MRKKTKFLGMLGAGLYTMRVNGNMSWVHDWISCTKYAE